MTSLTLGDDTHEGLTMLQVYANPTCQGDFWGELAIRRYNTHTPPSISLSVSPIPDAEVKFSGFYFENI